MTPRTFLHVAALLLGLLLAGRAASLRAQDVAPAAPPPAAPPPAAAQPAAPPLADEAPRYATFTGVLAACVQRGVVDYAALKQQEHRFDEVLAALAATDPAALSSDARKAFWINAYNAFTLKLILERMPEIRSIKDIPADKRWTDPRWRVNGRDYSLDQIEHEILRPLRDPRIHFAIVCASISCPDLRSEAYEPAALDAQLDDATRRFLADTRKGLRFGTEPGTFFGENQRVYLSAIFDWFEEDFTRDGRKLLDFVKHYAPAPAVAFLEAHAGDVSVRHLDYDWSLNDR